MKFFLVAYDSLHFQLGETLKGSYPLFADESGYASVLRDKNEEEIVDWLFFGHVREELTGFVYNPVENGEFLAWKTEEILKAFSCVPTQRLTDAKKVPGDIDLLIVPAADPKRSVALQCKRVKVKVQDEEADRINKLQELVGAAKQCKLTAGLGFSRTYLLVVLSVDAARARTANVITRDASDTTWNKVGNELRNCGIPPDIGIIIVAATQMTGKHPDHQGDISFGLFRAATEREQPSELTERIVRFMAAKQISTTGGFDTEV